MGIATDAAMADGQVGANVQSSDTAAAQMKVTVNDYIRKNRQIIEDVE